MNWRIYKIQWIWLLVLAFMATQSCKKFADPAPVFEDYGSDSTTTTTRKILIIGIDGFSGVALKSLHPAFLDSVMQHSKYTDAVYKEPVNDNVGAWKSMMTGTQFLTHQTSDSSFTAAGDESDPDEAPAPNPNNIFYYLLRYKPLSKSLLVTPWSNLATLLLKGANKTIVAPDDKMVRDSTVNLLASGNYDLCVINLNETALAQKSAGFDINSAQYKSAVQNVDGYIKDIMNAIQQRKTYDQENWLVMIVSNSGSLDNPSPDPGFYITYNKNFSKQLIQQNGDQVPFYSGSGSEATSPSASTSVYDVTPDNEMTVSFKLNVAAYGSLNPGIILKTASSANSNTGWWFCHNGANGSIRFVLRGTSGTHANTNNTSTSVTGSQGTNEWHSYTGKVYKQSDKRYMQLYMDGVPISQDPIDVTNLNCITTSALRLGQAGSYVSGTTSQYVTDIRIYNVALPDDVIAANACKMYLNADSDRYFNNLIGYWPSDDAVGNKLPNYAPDQEKNYMTMNTSLLWSYIPLQSNNLCYTSPYTYDPNNFYSIVPQNADVAPNILYWLRIDIDPKWNMDGTNWIKDFEVEYSK